MYWRKNGRWLWTVSISNEVDATLPVEGLRQALAFDKTYAQRAQEKNLKPSNIPLRALALISKYLIRQHYDNILILDLGGGTGINLRLLLDFLSKKKVLPVNIDLSLEGLKIAKESYEVYNVCSSIDALPLRCGATDLVLLIHVLEHVTNDDRVFDEVSRIMRKGGFLCIASPNKTRKLHPLFIFTDRMLGFHPLHVRDGYLPSELLRRCLTRGLICVQLEYYDHLGMFLKQIRSAIVYLLSKLTGFDFYKNGFIRRTIDGIDHLDKSFLKQNSMSFYMIFLKQKG